MEWGCRNILFVRNILCVIQGITAEYCRYTVSFRQPCFEQDFVKKAESHDHNTFYPYSTSPSRSILLKYGYHVFFCINSIQGIQTKLITT